MKKSNRFSFYAALVVMVALITFCQTAVAGPGGKSILVQQGKERQKKSVTFHQGVHPDGSEVSGVRHFHKENPSNAAKNEPTAAHHQQAEHSKTHNEVGASSYSDKEIKQMQSEYNAEVRRGSEANHGRAANENHRQAQAAPKPIIKHAHEPSAAEEEEEASSTMGALPAFKKNTSRRVHLVRPGSSHLTGN
ncbi:MAG: hypothetical protein ABIQ95_17170 [Bdellovibrionia bacterium]